MIFDALLDEIRNHIQGDYSRRSFEYDPNTQWGLIKMSPLVLKSTMGLELAAPNCSGVSALLPTNDSDKVKDGRITVIGKSISELEGKSVSFGKLVFIHMEEMSDELLYEKIQTLDLVRHDLYLDGYMVRSSPNEPKEWIRISKEAIKKGFSFKILGSLMMEVYKKIDYVRGVEIVFITESDTLIQNLQKASYKIFLGTKALNKIFDDLEYDCDECNFQDICDEIDGMKEMHRKV